MRILMITGNGYDDSEVLYPYYRLLEEGYEVVVASNEKGEVLGKYHFKINADIAFQDVKAKEYNALLIPGGTAPEKLRLMDDVLNITRAFYSDHKPVASICHGLQILISAKTLNGITATCYPGIRDDLINAGACYEDKNVVVSGKTITSRRPADLPYFMRELIRVLKKAELESSASSANV